MKYLKRWAVALFAVLLVSSAIPPTAQASDLLIGGQTHSYKVIFRGNGEAIVIGKMSVPVGDTELKSLDINLSVDDAAHFVAYQLVVAQKCATYEYLEDGTQKCSAYRAPTSAESRNPSSTVKLSPITEADGTYTLPLSSPVAPNATATVTFAFTSKEYTKESFRLFTYNFVTPTVNDTISSLKVTVQTDSDIALSSTEKTINYGGSLDSVLSESDAATTGLSASSLDTIVKRETGNTTSAYTSNLLPGESFTVSGSYSEHVWRLYLGKIIGGTIIVALLIIGGIIYRKRVLKQRANDPKNKASTASNTGVIATFHSHEGFVAIRDGLLAAIALSVWMLIASNDKFYRYMDEEGTGLFIILVTAMVFVLLAFGPAIVVGAKKGWKAGLMLIVSQIVWIILGILVMNFVAPTEGYAQYRHSGSSGIVID